MTIDYTDDVSGIIIGGDEYRYQFWGVYDYPLAGMPRKIAEGWFANDAEAVAWFQEHYPDEFARGAEMRVWDRP